MRETEMKAQKYFDDLWEQQGPNLLTDQIVPATMKDSATDPVDFCVSTVARLSGQEGGDVAGQTIRRALGDLLDSDSTQFIYPQESLHISLVGCTPRAESREAFSEEQISKIDSICESAISDHKGVTVVLKGIGLIGNQIFIQGIPLDDGWEELRTKIVDELKQVGEDPMEYKDKAPIHMNIVRITDASSDKLRALHDLIEGLRDVELGVVRLISVELVITDFVLNAQNSTSVKKYSFQD